MKQKIQLTESQLKQMISETVKNVLNEHSPFDNRNGSFVKTYFGGKVKTFNSAGIKLDDNPFADSYREGENYSVSEISRYIRNAIEMLEANMRNYKRYLEDEKAEAETEDDYYEYPKEVFTAVHRKLREAEYMLINGITTI